MPVTKPILILLTLCLTVAFAVLYFAHLNKLLGQKDTPPRPAANPNTVYLPDSIAVDIQSYKAVLNRLKGQRVVLALRYQTATSPAQQSDVIDQARDVLTQTIYKEIFPSWYGTS